MATMNNSQDEDVRVYWGDWREQDDLVQDFGIEPLDPGIRILFAYYTYENYSGDAYVLFTQDGKLFDVEGSHCSCYGLEGQWEPVEATKEALLAHDFSYRIEYTDARSRLMEVIATLPDEETTNGH